MVPTCFCSVPDRNCPCNDEGGVPRMNRFRLLHWVELPEEFHQLKFRRAMAAMSARPVARQQLASECGIDRKEMRVFIDALLRAGAISVHPPLRADYMRRMSRRRG